MYPGEAFASWHEQTQLMTRHHQKSDYTHGCHQTNVMPKSTIFLRHPTLLLFGLQKHHGYKNFLFRISESPLRLFRVPEEQYTPFNVDASEPPRAALFAPRNICH